MMKNCHQHTGCNDHERSAQPITLPLVGTLKSWQLAFMVVSLSGPLLLVALSALREPTRQEVMGYMDGPSEPML